MKKLLITFGGEPYDATTELMIQYAPAYGGLDRNVIVYDDKWLTETEFYQHNPFPWNHHHKRGFGWYCWKPYIIYRTLEDYCELGDVVMFLDADSYPVGSFGHLFENCEKEGGILLFRAYPWKHLNFCKRDCYLVMGMDLPQYTNPNLDHGVARFMLFQKGPWRTTQFLMEWLTYCINPLATTFDPSVILPEYLTLREHRTEQAIMTNLAIKYGIKLHAELDSEQGLFVQDNPRPVAIRQTSTEPIGSKFRNV